MYLTFEQCEVVEAEWRSIYGMQYRRVRSAPRAPLYSKGSKALDGGRTLRTHLWSTCLTSISSAMANAMGDVGDTQQRAAARSGVALAMERWGCREDPNRWQWGHLSGAIEQFLKASPVKYLGDAWMLAQTLAEEQPLEGNDKAAALAAARVQRLGRWECAAALASPEPLAASAAHWKRPKSEMFFEPTKVAGLGIRPSAALLQAGVVAVEHLSERAGVWMWRYATARLRHPLLPGTKAGAAEWERVLTAVAEAGLEAPAASSTATRHGELRGQLSVAECNARAAKVARSGAGRVRAVGFDEAAVASMMAKLKAAQGAAPVLGARSSERKIREWKAEMQACWSGVVPRPAVPWQCGVVDVGERAKGPTLFCSLEGAVHVEGGEARYRKRIGVGEDGFQVGWEAAMLEEMATVSFDDEVGLPRLTATGDLITLETVGELGLGPSMQMLCRARLMMPADVQIVSGRAEAYREEHGARRKDTHVSLTVQADNVHEVCMWGARVGATHVMSGDASRARDGACSRGSLRNDGLVKAGMIVEDDCDDNYLAELAAILDQAAAVPRGSRIVIMLDATSPVHAFIKFRAAHARRRAGYYGSTWLDTLDQLLDGLEAVVFLWQRSHVGSPMNEVADLLAGSCDRDASLAVVRRPGRSSTMRPSRPKSSVRGWHAPRAQAVVYARLQAAMVSTIQQSAGDVELGPLADGYELICQAVASDRCQVGDSKRIWGAATSAAVIEAGCPSGCLQEGSRLPCACTWEHAQLRCRGVEVVRARAEWAEAMRSALREVGPNREHEQLQVALMALSEVDGGRGQYMGAAAEAQMKRFVCGFFEEDDARFGGGTKARKGMLRMVRDCGLEVQRAAKGAAKQLEADMADHGRMWALTRRLAGKWLAVTRRSGPARVGLLHEVGLARGRVRAFVLRAHAKGRVPRNDLLASAVWCGQDPRPRQGTALERLYRAAAEEIAEVREEAPRCTPAQAAKGWLMAARFAM